MATNNQHLHKIQILKNVIKCLAMEEGARVQEGSHIILHKRILGACSFDPPNTSKNKMQVEGVARTMWPTRLRLMKLKNWISLLIILHGQMIHGMMFHYGKGRTLLGEVKCQINGLANKQQRETAQTYVAAGELWEYPKLVCRAHPCVRKLKTS